MEIYPKCLPERQRSYFISILRLLKNFGIVRLMQVVLKWHPWVFPVTKKKKKDLDSASKFSEGSEINIDVKYFSLI